MDSAMNAPETVHIVDDDAGVRDSLQVLLGAAGFAVRTYDGAAAFLAAAPGPGGCVLTDLCMPGLDGLELQRRLNDRGAPLPVIVMTGHGDIAIAVRAMKAGAVDFLEKPFSDEDLLSAVHRALEQSKQLREHEEVAAGMAARLATLTPREQEVLGLLADGLPTKAIANELGASPRTIEVHRARVFEKLQVHNLPGLVRVVLAAGHKDPRHR